MRLVYELVNELAGTFTLRVTPSLARSLLAEGAPPQRAYDGFTLRVTRADLYPGTLDLLVEVVFEDEAMARRWTDLHDPTTPCVVALNPQGQLDWSDSYTFGVPTLRPDPLPDGRWVAECPISYSSILRLPEHVVICPRVVATNLENEGPYWIITALPGQEEGIVLPLP